MRNQDDNALHLGKIHFKTQESEGDNTSKSIDKQRHIIQCKLFTLDNMNHLNSCLHLCYLVLLHKQFCLINARRVSSFTTDGLEPPSRKKSFPVLNAISHLVGIWKASKVETQLHSNFNHLSSISKPF